MADSLRFRLTGDREHTIERAMEALGETEKSKAIERALRHVVESIEAYDEVKDELTPEQARTLSTSQVTIAHYPQVRV